MWPNRLMGGVSNSADRLNLVIELIWPDTTAGKPFAYLFLPTAQEGRLSADANVVYPAPRPSPPLTSSPALRTCVRDIETGAPSSAVHPAIPGRFTSAPTQPAA